MNLKSDHDLLRELFQKIEKLNGRIDAIENNQKPYAMPEHIMCPIEFKVIGDVGKPNPGEGYRFLEDNEIIEESDYRFGSINKKWTEATKTGLRPCDIMPHSIYRRKIEQPEPKHRYIESAEDIVPWQYYVIPTLGVCRIIKCYDDEFQDADEFSYTAIRVTNTEGDSNWERNDLVRAKTRIAEIHEIPDHCLIGSRVRAWNEGSTREPEVKNGVLVKKYNDKNYVVFDPEDELSGYYENIELIDPRGE